jgi:hypothetical protein
MKSNKHREMKQPDNSWMKWKLAENNKNEKKQAERNQTSIEK